MAVRCKVHLLLHTTCAVLTIVEAGVLLLCQVVWLSAWIRQSDSEDMA